MKTKNVNWIKILALGFAVTLFSACDDDNNEPMGNGDVEFEITDAPSDDASVEAVMVTVSDLKIDGESVAGFSKQTIDLKAFQEGNTKLLATAEQIEARTYNDLTLVLDLDADVDGNAPGCYILTTDGAKYKLKSTDSGTTTIDIDKSWSVTENTTTKVVMDFDLRKAITHSDDEAERYRFVSDANLRNAVRLVTAADAGTVEGTYVENGTSNADKIIVYAYKNGTFDASVETQPQGEDNLLFANAITSAELKQGIAGGTYTLAFLEEGDYEIHFGSYNEDESGKMTFGAMLESETSIEGSVVDSLTVSGGATLNVSSTIAVGL